MRTELWDGVRMLVCSVNSEDIEHKAHLNSWSSFLMDAAQLLADGRIVVQRSTVMPLDFARSQLAQAAANPENGFTHMYMFDSDMEISLEKIEKLLSRGVDVVSGTYFMGGFQPHDDDEKLYPFPCVAQRFKSRITRPMLAEAMEKDELIEVDGTGAGALLVTAEALRNIGPEAFRWHWGVTNSGAFREGEDNYFCRLARVSGYKVWLDPTVLLDHYKFIRVGFYLRDMNGQNITTFDL